MKYLIFDTETTGLPLRQIDYDTLRDSTGAVPVQYNPNGSTRLAQLSWQLSDEEISENIRKSPEDCGKTTEFVTLPLYATCQRRLSRKSRRQ